MKEVMSMYYPADGLTEAKEGNKENDASCTKFMCIIYFTSFRGNFNHNFRLVSLINALVASARSATMFNVHLKSKYFPQVN